MITSPTAVKEHETKSACRWPCLTRGDAGMRSGVQFDAGTWVANLSTIDAARHGRVNGCPSLKGAPLLPHLAASLLRVPGAKRSGTKLNSQFPTSNFQSGAQDLSDFGDQAFG